MKFFVTGYPRSRTAWLAAFLSEGHNLCLHEALLGCPSLDAFYALMKGVHGNSDSGLPLFAGDVSRRFPKARWVIVERPLEEVSESLARMGYPDDVLPFLRPGLEWVKEHLSPLVIDFSEVDAKAAQIFRHCLGRDPHPRRLEMFRNLHIETMNIDDRIEESKTAIASLLEERSCRG